MQAAPFGSQFATVIVKPRGGQQADALANALRRDVGKVDSNLPLYFVGTPKKNLDGFVGPNRIIATMFSIFGVVAVVLASVGIYGVMSFSVNQRTAEFGVRMALGAPGRRILGMVLRQGAIQIALGLCSASDSRWRSSPPPGTGFRARCSASARATRSPTAPSPVSSRPSH